MAQQIKASVQNRRQDDNIHVNRYPDECPICHHSIAAEYQKAVFTQGKLLDVSFRCPHPSCKRMFIGIYGASGNMWNLKKAVPVTPLQADVPKEVAGISSGFVEIYNQALAAEAAGLDQLFGVGLRKALEFLVKDYLVSLKPGEEEKIRHMKLGVCIRNHIDDPRLKECAQRAAWLGNDETHYARRWEDKDITDLKRLIRLTILWVESALVTQAYMKDMPEGGQGPAPAAG